jgi:sortase A
LSGTLARIVGVIGRVLVAAGLLLLFYTAYLLWGTGVYTHKVQHDLAQHLEANPIVSTLPAGQIPAARPSTKPGLGDPLFTIVIPKIGLRTVVVEGVEPDELKKGPGHFPDAPWPGEDGNVPISGHRTTYAAPFYRVNELQPGDVIAIESGPVRYKYTVTEQKIVDPVTGYGEVENHGVNEITLTSCHPRFSASQRLIIHGRYDGPELIQTARPVAGRGKGGNSQPASSPAIPKETILLGAMAVAAWLGAMALSKRLRMTALWAALSISAAAGLWTAVFPRVIRLMPSNY